MSIIGFLAGFGPPLFLIDNNDLSRDDEIKQMTEFQLKDIIINRNLYQGKTIAAVKQELERRGISLTVVERQQQEANKDVRIQETKRNTRKKKKEK